MQEQLLLVERDLGAMQMEALELRGSARSREAEAAALRERVAEQEQQVLILPSFAYELETLVVFRFWHGQAGHCVLACKMLTQRCSPCHNAPTQNGLSSTLTRTCPLGPQIAELLRQLTQRSSPTAEEEAALGGVSTLRAELAAKEALLQRAQVGGTP